MKQYMVVLLPDTEAGGFTVTVPSLPGCITEGDSYEEALANAREAITLHIEGQGAGGGEGPGDDPPPAIAFVQIA